MSYHDHVGPLQAVEVFHAVLDGFRALLAADEDGGLVVLDGLRLASVQSPFAALVARLDDTLHQTHPDVSNLSSLKSKEIRNV